MNGMDMRNAALILVVIAILVPSANAITVERIEVLNCGFQSGSLLACGQTVVAQCSVNDTYTGSPAPTIVNVVFFIGNGNIDATLVAGTTRSGVWSAEIDPETYAVNGIITFSRAIAFDSAFNPTSAGCSMFITGANQNSQMTECIGSSGTVVSVPTACSCTHTVTTSCSQKNVLTKSIIPSSGCVGESVIMTTGTCDYCDPRWTPVISNCQASTEWNVTDRFLGVATKTYVTSGPDGETCRQLGQNGQGDPADANPPPDDGALVLCRMDAWSAEGKDASGSNRHEGSTSVRYASKSTNFTVSIAVGSDVVGRILKPLVFDVNQDGVQELVVFGPSGWTVVRTDGVVMQQLSLPNTEWEGQPSLWNYNYAGAQLFSPALRNGSQGAGVAGIYYNQTDGHDYFIAVNFNQGTGIGLPRTYNIDTKVSCPGTVCAVGSGVVCADTYCWYVTNTQKPVLVDMTYVGSLAAASIVYDPLYPASVYDTSASITPVLINMGAGLGGYFPPRPMAVAWFGKTNTPKMAWFACTVTGVCTYQELDSSIDLANVSNVVTARISSPAASCLGARTGDCSQFGGDNVSCLNHGCNTYELAPYCTGAQVPCSTYLDKGSCEMSYCTWSQTGTASVAQLYVNTEVDVNGTRTATLRSIEIVGTGINGSGYPSGGLSFQNAKANVISGVAGGAEKCMSEPASAKCASGYPGVAMLSSWKPTTSTAITYSPWTMPQTIVTQPVRQVTVPFSGLSDSSIAGLSRELCGVHNCYVVSGATQGPNMLGNYVMYWNKDDGPYSQLSTYGLIDFVSKGSGELNWSNCLGTWNLGQRILGMGMYKDDLVVLLWTPLASTSGLDCNNVLQDVKLMRWVSATGTWSTVYDFGVKTLGSGNTGYFGVFPSASWSRYDIAPLRCGENGGVYCMWRKGNMAGPVANWASAGEIVVNMETSSLQHIANLKGAYFGGNLNATVQIDYAYTTTGDDVFSVGNAVVFYGAGNPNVPRILEQSTDSTRRFYGLAQSPVDNKVYWVGMPVNVRNGGVACAAANVTGVDYLMSVPGMGNFYYPRSIEQYSNLPYWPYACIGSSNYSTATAHNCYVEIGQYVINGAVAVAADAYWVFPYNNYLETYANTDGYFNLRPYAGFDQGGKYFVVYPVKFGSGNGPSGTAYMVSYKDGGVLKSYFPAGALSGYNNGTVTQLLSASSCVVGGGAGGLLVSDGTCGPGRWIGDISGTGCLPQDAGVQGGSFTGGPPTPVQSRIIRNFDTTIGKVTIDYITGVTNASAATSDYNQLDCYAYIGPSNAGMTTDASKQIGSAYCTNQLASGEVNGDNRDELLTPEGLFSIGGSNVPGYRFAGVLTTKASAMELVDVNQDTYSDVLQVTAAGIKGVMSKPSTRGYSNTGLVASNQLHCTYARETDQECMAMGGSESDCTETTLYYAPQVAGSKNPMYWSANVYEKNTAGIGTTLNPVSIIISPVLDALFRLLGINRFFNVPDIPQIIPSAIDSRSYSLVASTSQYMTSEWGSYLVPETGTYLVSLALNDPTTGEVKAGLWCEENVTIPAPIPPPPCVGPSCPCTGPECGRCTLGENGIDGEFNYAGDVTTHNWAVTATQTSGKGYSLNGASLTVSPATDTDVVVMSHEILCDSQTLLLQTRFRIASTDAGIQNMDVYGTTESGKSVPLSLFQMVVKKGNVEITAFGGMSNPQTVYQDVVNTSQWIIVDVLVDRKAKTVQTAIDGTTLSVTTDVMNDAPGPFSGVTFSADGKNMVEYDYIRLNASGGIIPPCIGNCTIETNAFKFLNNCSTLIQRINVGGNEYDPKRNVSPAERYPDVNSYCIALHGVSGCTGYGKTEDAFKDLKYAVQYNPVCYDEAYQYCVLNTYPSQLWVGGSGKVASLSGTDGATVCTAELMVSAGTVKIGIPLLQLAWSLFRSYWLYFTLLFAIVLIISMATGKRR